MLQLFALVVLSLSIASAASSDEQLRPSRDNLPKERPEAKGGQGPFGRGNAGVSNSLKRRNGTTSLALGKPWDHSGLRESFQSFRNRGPWQSWRGTQPKRQVGAPVSVDGDKQAPWNAGRWIWGKRIASDTLPNINAVLGKHARPESASDPNLNKVLVYEFEEDSLKRSDWINGRPMWGKKRGFQVPFPDMPKSWEWNKRGTNAIKSGIDSKRAQWTNGRGMWGKRSFEIPKTWNSWKRDNWHRALKPLKKQDSWTNGRGMWGKRHLASDKTQPQDALGAEIKEMNSAKKAQWTNGRGMWGKRGSEIIWRDFAEPYFSWKRGPQANIESHPEKRAQRTNGRGMWGKRALKSYWRDDEEGPKRSSFYLNSYGKRGLPVALQVLGKRAYSLPTGLRLLGKRYPVSRDAEKTTIQQDKKESWTSGRGMWGKRGFMVPPTELRVLGK